MSDLVTFGEGTLRLSPRRGERLETAPRFDAHVGGPESGVAVAAAQLGTAASWLSKLPDSPLGRRVVRDVEGHGVDARVAWADPGTARVATHYLERGAAPRTAGRRHERTGGAVGSAATDEASPAAVREARVFEVSGATPALSDRARETTANLLEAAAEGGTATVFDARHRADLWSREAARETFEALFPAVDVLVVDPDDAVAVFDTSEQRVELAHGLATTYDFRTVVVVRADGGILVLDDDEVHERSAVAAETVDPVGVREALVGGFLAARLDGEPVPAALDRAAAAAALARTVEGDFLVTTPAEVDDVVARVGDED
ncbi:MAG: PfkB family carbohydrate kinase [Haloferacaceae archaeon]